MPDRMPFALPGPFEPVSNYQNPGQTVPQPTPGKLPVGCWIGARVTLSSWGAVSSDVLWQVTWSSPIFDMRPDLGVLMGGNRNASHPSAIPIWRSGGQNVCAQLFVQVANITDFRGFQVVTQEEAHVSDITQVESITAETDVTGDYTSKGDSCIVGYNPTGDGYPVRYWRLKMFFRYLAHLDAPTLIDDLPQIVLSGAMY